MKVRRFRRGNVSFYAPLPPPSLPHLAECNHVDRPFQDTLAPDLALRKSDAMLLCRTRGYGLKCISCNTRRIQYADEWRREFDRGVRVPRMSLAAFDTSILFVYVDFFFFFFVDTSIVGRCFDFSFSIFNFWNLLLIIDFLLSESPTKLFCIKNRQMIRLGFFTYKCNCCLTS